MATLEQLRAYFPTAESDSDVIKLASKQFGIDPVEIANEVGFKFNKPGFFSDIKRGTGQAIGAIGSTARDLGLPNVGKAVEGYGEDVAYRNPSQINTVGEAIRSPLTTIRESVGEIIPQVGTAVGAGMAGRFVGGAIGSLAGPGGTIAGQAIGGAAGTYLGNLAQSYGGIRAEQREQGIEDKGRAGTAAAGSAFLDTAFGAERIANKFLSKGSDILAREAGTSLLKNVGKQTAIGIGTESLTEGAQTGIERYGAFKPLTGDEAYNEYGLSMIKGGIGGGVVRGGLASIAGERAPEGGNDIQQAFSQPSVSGTPTTNVVPPVAPPAPPATPPTVPAVTGGTTDIAQQTQAAAAENQQVQEAQQKLVNREDVFGKVATQYDPANPTSLNIFGQNIEGPRVAPFGDRFAAVFNTLPPHVQQIAQAITQANNAFATPEKPSPLVSFNFNANNPVPSADKAVAALGKVMTKFQIDHVQSLDEATQILNKLSTTTKGNQLEQLNAIYEALTGQDTDGFTAAQTAKAEKGAKDGKLPVQTTTGLGAVSVEGGAGEANAAVDGNVQPSGVQSVGTGSLPAGSLGLQVGQSPAEGIRDGTGAVSNVVGSNAPSQVTGAANEQASQGALGGGQAPGQSQQAGQPLVDQQSVQNGPRQYDPRIGFYSTDLSHISSERRVELISDLLLRVLAPLQNRKNTVPAEKRAEILRLALLEQFRHADIAEYTGLKVDTVEKQLERMGVKLVDGEFQVIDPEFAVRIVETATAYRSPEFPDGIGQGELAGLYNTRYEGDEQSAASLAEELEAGEQEGKPGAKLQEELGGKEDKEGQTMGTVATAGGSQGAVDSEGTAALAKIEKLQAAVDKNPQDKKAVTALANAWTAYAKSQKERANKGEKTVKQESEEEADLTGEVVAEEPKEETVNEVEVAKRKKVVDEARAKAAADRKGLDVGDTVINPKLGTGKVLSFAGNGDDTRVTVEFQSGQTKELLVKSAKLEKTNAVQKPSTTEVSVREGAGGGKAVGQGNAQGGKTAGKAEVKPEPKQEAKPEEIKTPTEQWAVVSTLAPELPPYDVLTNSEKTRWDDLVRRGQANLAAAVKIVGESTQPAGTALANQGPQATGVDGTTQAVTNEANVIDVEARVIDETVGPQVAALPAPQVDRLEKHYGVKRDSAEFLAKIKEDVVKYATKGAEAVSAAVRDIIKAIHTGVLAAAMVFNPTAISKVESFIVIPQETQTTQQQVLATVPAEASMMSDAGKQAYERLIPALKGKLGNKFITIADKPSGRIFVFKSDGSFVLQKKSLFGLAKGDLYKGNNDLPQNRVTPAGLFGIKIIDAAKGGNAAKTAGEYDFGKVFALEDPDAVVTFMHSVWLKEKDAPQRAAALKSESAADSRYSFGCINVDKETYRELITKYGDNMDGSKLFVVPDVQSTVNDFITGNVADDRLVREGVQPVTRTVTTPVRSATQVAGADRSVVGKEEQTPSFNSKSAKFMEFSDLEDEVKGISDVREQFADMDIEGALDFVSDWQVINDRSKDAFHGQLKTENGRYIGVLNLAKMSSPAYAAETVRHEVAHAVDMAPHGGVYSHQLEMNVEIKNGKVVPFGEVAKEMFALYENNKAFTTFLDYPFNIEVHTDLDTNGKIESELFAQIFSIYTNPKYTDYIASVAPKTATFLEEVINDIRTTTALQIQKSTTAATRAIDFRNRYTARRNQREAGVYGGDRQTDEGPFNSRGQGREFTADQVIGALPKPLQKSARSQWTNIKTLAKRGMYASAITEDVIGMAKKYMPSAAKYLQAQYARQGTRLEFEKRIENILSRFDKLPTNLKGEGKGSVNEYIHDSTREKKWGYYPGEQQVGTKLFEVDPDFEERFNKIQAQSPAAAQLIKDVFRHGHEALKLKQKAAEDAVNREFDSRIKAAGSDADLLQSLNKEKRQVLKRMSSLRNVNVSDPYAYLGRYGDYVVVAKSKEFIAYEEAATGTRSSARGDSIIGDPQQAKNWLQENVSNPIHYVVQFAETQGEADDIAAELQATGQYDVQPEDAGIKEASASYIGDSDVHMAVARLRNLAQRQSDSTDARLDKAISDLYLMTVAESSARRSELQRKNVSGADKNMMRNLATSGRADAHFLATMERSDELNDALEAMRDEARRNRKDAMPLYNELYTRYADSMEYEQPGVLTQNLLRMSTLWNLSTSPAYYLQQVLQTSVLSLPYMAGRLGYFRSARAIKRAYNDMSGLIAGLGINDPIDFDKAPADVRFMLKELVRMGKIDIGIDAEARARTDEQGVLGKVMFKLQGVNTRIEAINRATAAIAAYRGYTDRYKGATGADGVRFAAEVVSNTHGNYDGFNTPRILQSGGAKVLLQFKRFQIIQLSMLAKLIHTSFKGASAEERTIARASLKYITAHMAVLGGALGVPFVSQAASILSSIFGDEDEPDDYEYKLRRMIGNDAVADLLLRGVPAALGLESIGKRLSMENVASPFGPFVDFNLTSRADAAQMIVGMMGPAAGLGLKFVDALGMMSKGNYYKGLEMALPNGIGNVMKSYRFATEGITMRNGDLVMKPEEISMIDAAFQAVGLPTTTITDRQYTQKVVAEFDKFYASRAGEIKASYVEGSRASDPAAMAEARDDWQKLQESRVRNGYKRQSMSELFRAPAEARKRERGVVGGVETTKSNRRFVEAQVNQ